MSSRSSDQRSPNTLHSDGLTRRDFLRLSAGVVVLFTLGGNTESQSAAPLEGWLRIGPDGRVSVFTPTPEVGQGLRTSLAQMVAEELSLPLSSVDMIMGDTDRVPAESPTWPGSAITTIGPRLRSAAAQAREMLRDLAAGKWGVSREAVQIQDGKAVLATDVATAIPIGELAKESKAPRGGPEAPPLKSPGECRLIGQSEPRVDGKAIVTGAARFVGDLRLENMVYAELLRAPCLGARLVQAVTRGAAAQPGVIAVVEQDDFIAVIASRPDLAEKGLRRLRASWQEPEHPDIASLHQELRSSAKLAKEVDKQGDVEAALAAAQYGFSASYRTPFVAHAPIEPHGALAAVEDDRVIVYVSTQRPFAHRDAVARTLGLPTQRVRVIATPAGGAFGGKNEPDVSVAAARLARAVRRPVMLMHSREEELTWNYFRPAALVDLQCAVSGAGKITAWACDVFNCGPRGAATPYTFPSRRIRSYRCQSPLPQGPWRGDGGTANTFARESHLDHIASELDCDPIDFRLRHLPPESRLARVISAAADAYRWRPRRAPTGSGIGFACAADSGACVAQIAEVEVSRPSGQVRIRRVLIAYETGLIINPDGLQNQIEGAVIMGLGPALREAVRYEQGRILTNSFASYPIPTIRDTPVLETILLPNPDRPPQAGGTPAIFPVAAAIANAVFDATGRRIRDLPLTPERIRAAMQAAD